MGSMPDDLPLGTTEKDQPELIHLPNTLAKFPWPKALNPHEEECTKSSHAWLASFNMLSSKALSTVWSGRNGYLASVAWSRLPKHGFQIGCDLLNMFYILDGTTDRCASAEEAKVLVHCFMDALRSPDTPRPQDEWKGALIAQSFMERMMNTPGTTSSSITRLVDTMQQFCDGVVEQAGDRSREHVRDMETYFQVRRGTIGLYPCFAVLQHEMELPDEIHGHEILRRLEQLAADMVILDNDLVSYNVEQARGDEAHNLVAVVMNQFGLGLQESIDYIGRHYERIMNEFLEVYSKVPLVFPGNEEVKVYTWGVGNWVRGNWQWSWETARYFPNMDGLECLEQRDGMVALLPKKM